VSPDLNALAALQGALSASGMQVIVARDLPTTLMAITQHYFDAAVVASRISEEGDGWPVASVVRMVFPKAFLAVIAPNNDVLTLKAAINSGINELFPSALTAEQISSAVTAHFRPGNPGPTASATVH
jgi:DNA-binding NtrC family response regulator